MSRLYRAYSTFMNENIARCVICSKAISPETAGTDDRGLPVHQKCYALVSKARGVKGGDGRPTVRCPYCVEDRSFKLMNARSGGEWFLCPACGHAAMPGHAAYRCDCSNCAALA